MLLTLPSFAQNKEVSVMLGSGKICDKDGKNTASYTLVDIYGITLLTSSTKHNGGNRLLNTDLGYAFPIGGYFAVTPFVGYVSSRHNNCFDYGAGITFRATPKKIWSLALSCVLTKYCRAYLIGIRWNLK